MLLVQNKNEFLFKNIIVSIYYLNYLNSFRKILIFNFKTNYFYKYGEFTKFTQIELQKITYNVGVRVLHKLFCIL